MNWQKINLHNLFVDNPTQNAVGQNVPLFYLNDKKKKQKLEIITPILTCKFGIDKEGENKYSMCLQIPRARSGSGKPNTQKQTNSNTFDKNKNEFSFNVGAKFYAFISELDKKLEHVVQNPALLLEKIPTKFYSPMRDSNKKYDPMIKVKLPIKNRKCQFQVFRDNKEVGIKNLTKGTRMSLVLECRSLWIVQERYGYFWSIKKILLA